MYDIMLRYMIVPRHRSAVNFIHICIFQVDNGSGYGNWTEAEFCPDGQFAVGYDMKVGVY